MSSSQQFEQWIQHSADQLTPESVPEWARERSYEGHAQLAWWQRPWLPMTSLAGTALALLLVIGQVQFSSTSQGFKIQFGGIDEQALTAMVEQRVQKYNAEQQLVLANYANSLREDFRADMRSELADSNAQLVNYVLATNRDERRDDMTDLIEYVNAQREDDQIYFANSLAQFSEDWYQNQAQLQIEE